jgi:uncharacterized protein (TIGR03437 family)
MKLLLIAFVSISLTVHAAPSTTLVHLPNSTISAVKADAAGNIYLTGSQGTQPAAHAFVTKLTSTGTIAYSTVFAGSNNDVAVAIDVDSAGAAYICGYTSSPDFPVTSGALQTTLQAATQQGFAAKVDATGKVVYVTFFGGSANAGPGAGGLVVDSAGEAFISGTTFGDGFPSTPGAPFNSTDSSTSFIMKLDTAGRKLLAAFRGIGGRLALDGQGNVYIAGLQMGVPTAVPITPGAFQSTFQLRGCGGDDQVGFACSYQYVTKLNASLSQIVYSTYVTGSFGASPAAISIDSQGQAFVAGTTNSPDYPTTSNTFQPSYIAGAPPPPEICLFGCIVPPPASGYVTQLNSAGTGLVYSTYFSGTQTDTITSAVFTANGIYLSGSAGSPDLPGFDGFPAQCLPQTYATRMSTDATEVGAARATPGSVLGYDEATGQLLVSTGPDLVGFDPTALPVIACILDSADSKPVTSVAPGQLLTLFGQHLLASSNDGITVSINGVASPLLYTGSQQINLQAPFEIAGSAQASIVFGNKQLNLSDSRTLPIVAINPAAFLGSTISLTSLANCRLSGEQYNGGPSPLAYNADGTRNSCANPAAPGSVVQIFLEGLGMTSPAPTTGGVTPNPGPSLNLPITFPAGLPATVVSASEVPGSISGVWQVNIRMPANDTGAVPVSLLVSGVPLTDPNLTVWVQ